MVQLGYRRRCREEQIDLSIAQDLATVHAPKIESGRGKVLTTQTRNNSVHWNERYAEEALQGHTYSRY